MEKESAMFGLSVLEKYLFFKTKKWVYLQATNSFEKYRLYRERLDKRGIDYRVRIIELSEKEQEDIKREENEISRYCFQFYVRPGKRDIALMAIGIMPKSLGPFYCSAAYI